MTLLSLHFFEFSSFISYTPEIRSRHRQGTSSEPMSFCLGFRRGMVMMIDDDDELIAMRVMIDDEGWGRRSIGGEREG